MTMTSTFSTRRWPCYRLLFVLFVCQLSVYGFSQDNLDNKNIYNRQPVDPKKSSGKSFYPARFSETLANNWKIIIDDNPDRDVFFNDTYSEIFDYRVFGDSEAVVVARKNIPRVVPLGDLRDSTERAIYYYYKKHPENNHQLSVSRFHYEEFDENGFIGVTDAVNPNPYYISIKGEDKLETIGATGFSDRTLHPSIQPGLFITEDETTDKYYCGFLRAGALTNPFQNESNGSVFTLPHNIVIAGEGNAWKFYRFSRVAPVVQSQEFEAVQLARNTEMYFIVRKAGGITAVLDLTDFSTKDISIDAAEGIVEWAFINPFSDNLIIRTRKDDEVKYWRRGADMSGPFKTFDLPSDHGVVQPISGNYLLYTDNTGANVVMDLFSDRTLALGNFPNASIRESFQWSAPFSLKLKNQRSGDDSLFFVIDHDIRGSADKHSIAFCVSADATPALKKMKLHTKDNIGGSIYENDVNKSAYQPLYQFSQKRFLIFQKDVSGFVLVRDIKESFQNPTMRADEGDCYVSVRPFVKNDKKWVAKAIEYKNGKEKIQWIKVSQ